MVNRSTAFTKNPAVDPLASKLNAGLEWTHSEQVPSKQWVARSSRARDAIL